MLNSYNPFSNKRYETEHGIINYLDSMGTTYITHRRPEHFFKKYQGFGISNSELEIAYNRRVYWILIIYHGKDGTDTLYRIKLDEVHYLKEYNNKGDQQRIFPVKEMEMRREEEWQ